MALEFSDDRLAFFVLESNFIERIVREPEPAEIDVHRHFLQLEQITIGDLEMFVSVIQPGAKLRRWPNMNVMIGGFEGYPGGQFLERELLLLLFNLESSSPYQTHTVYEILHPFTDGNGRSGRAIWLWQMLRGEGSERWLAQKLGFLQSFYYQALNDARSTLEGVTE